LKMTSTEDNLNGRQPQWKTTFSDDEPKNIKLNLFSNHYVGLNKIKNISLWYLT
jgi:hypothetical protein